MSFALSPALSNGRCRSALKATALKDAQRRRQRPVLAVVRDVPTRWLSLHAMLSRFLAVYPDILFLTLSGAINPERAGANDDERQAVDDFVTPAERAVLQRYVAVLDPLARFVNDAEGERYVTLAAVPVLYKRCLKAMAAVAGDDALTITVKRRLHDAVTLRLGFLVTEPNLALAASALHPAFGHLKFVSDDVRDSMLRELSRWASEFPDAADIHVQSSPAEEQETFLKVLTAMYRNFVAKAPPGVEGDALHIPDDIAPYDPLAFWRQVRGKLSQLQTLVRLVLSVPATSAASERAFSSAGFTVSKYRSKLSEENVTMISTVRDYLNRTGSREAFFDRCADKLRKAAQE